MKIELKNIAHSEALSEETNAFTANVYIDGRHAGYATNQGHGGNTDIHPKDPAGGELLKKADEYCKTLPPKMLDMGSETVPFQMDLEAVVDDLLEQHLEKKFEKKIEKATVNGIVFGTPGGDSFSVIKFNTPIATLLTYPHGAESIKQAVERNILDELKDGGKVLNTNIPEKILKEAGLSADQYMKPKAPVRRQAKQKRPGKKL